MATRTWLGTTSDWNSKSNWAGNAVPTNKDSVIDNTTNALVISSGAALAASLNFSLSGANLTIAGGSSLAVSAAAALVAGASMTNSGATTATVNLGTNANATATLTGAGAITSSSGTFAVNFYKTSATDAIVFGAAAGSALVVTGSGASVSNFGSIQSLATTAEVDLLGATENYTFASALDISGGVLKLGNSDTLTDSSGITMAGGTIGGVGTIAANISGYGTIGITGSVTVASPTDTLTASGGTLELASAQSSSAITYKIADVAGSVLQIDDSVLASGSTLNFASTSVHAQVLIDASVGGTGLSGDTITNFVSGDTIVVADAGSFKATDATHVSFYAASDGSGTALETVTFGSALPAGIVVSKVYSTDTITAACYLEGTNVLTATGEVAVEDLEIGDMVATVEGPQPIRWIGKRAYLGRLINQHHREGLMPVRISAGALDENVPVRDLFVSPEHMMMLDGVLVAAHNLVNGTTITRHVDLDVVKYFHIELPQHSIMFAEGAAAESYLDTGNRNMFSNVLDYAELGLPVGDATPCLPIVAEGPALLAIRSRLAERAEACGFTTTKDADMHLLVDGVAVYPVSVERGSYRFDIAQPTADVRIVSRSAVPAEIDPACADRRRLGVAVSGLAITGGGLALDMLAGESRLFEGFHAAEGQVRWTNGDAKLPAALLALMAGAFSIELRVMATELAYPVAATSAVVTLAAARHDMQRQQKVA